MSLVEKAQDWIEWSRRNIPSGGDIPKINSRDFDFPWRGDLPGIAVKPIMGSPEADIGPHLEPESLLTFFVDGLAANPGDVATRFTALHIYYSLSFELRQDVYTSLLTHFPPQRTSEAAGDLEDICDDQTDEIMERFHNDLALLVGLLKPEEVPQEWRYVRWEILNSYAISDWSRALKLYSLADYYKLIEPDVLQLIRGLFRYLVVFGEGVEQTLNSLWWEPKVYGRDEGDNFFVLLMSGLRLNEFRTELTPSKIEELRYASSDLENAFTRSPKFRRLYAAVLARCYFSTGRFRDAASYYEQMLRTGGGDNLRRWIYESLETVYRAAEETGKAVELLERWAKEFPSEKGVYLRIAELQSQQGNYDAVPISIREEMERNTELDSDWRIGSLLALGAVRDVSEDLLSQLKSTHQDEPIDLLLTEYWPPFANLAVEAKEKWVYGTWLLHFCRPQDKLRGVQFRNAVVQFAMVVEIELRDKVFSRFRDHALGLQELVSIAEQELEKPAAKGKEFCQLILKGRRLPTLGEMLYAMDPEHSDEAEMFGRFRAWVEQNYFRLTSHLRDLGKINKFRNAEIHTRIESSDEQEISALCRRVLELLSEGTRAHGT